MSGAVKRRNGEEEELGMDDHVGKMRKKEAGTGHCTSDESPRPLSDNQVCVSPSSWRLKASCRKKETCWWFWFFVSRYSIVTQKGWKDGLNIVTNDQSLAAQLQEVKHQTASGPVINAGSSTIKEQLKRVFEKLRLQIVEEFLEVCLSFYS